MNDITFCYGKNCALKECCYRYVEGQKHIGQDELNWWMTECDPETREHWITIDDK